MENLTDVEKKVINQLYNRKSERIVRLDCIDCGEEFETTVGRICGTYHNGYIVPCRCPKCKQIKDEKFKEFAKEELDK